MLKPLFVFACAGLTFAGVAGPKMKAVYTVPYELDVLLKHGHIQGAACSEQAIYLAHQGGIVKIDWQTSRLVKEVEAPPHLGDIAYAKGRIYGAAGVRTYAEGEAPSQVMM